MAITSTEVAKLYVALFHRAAEKSGAEAWVSMSADKTFAQIADLMLDTTASKDFLGEDLKTNEAFINRIYKHLFNKDKTTDAEGVKVWAEALDKGMSKGEAVKLIMETALTDEAAAADNKAAKIFKEKVAISEYSATKIDKVDNGPDGKPNYKFFQDLLKNVTGDNLNDKKAEVDAALPGQTKDLTTGIDNLEGTSGKDTYNAVVYVGKGTKESTLRALDKIDGKGGDDTLNILFDANNGELSSPAPHISEYIGPNVKVENLNLTIASSISTINTTDALKGYKNLNIETVQKGQLQVESEIQDSININSVNSVNLTDNVVKNVVAKSSGGDLNVAADKAETISVAAGKVATVDAAEAKSVVVKANDDSTIDTAAAQKIDIDLGSNTKTLTINTALTEATDITLSNLSLGATTFAKAPSLVLDKVALTGDITAGKLAKVNVKDSDIGAHSLVSQVVDGFDLTLEGKSSVAQLKAADLKNLSIHANAEANEAELNAASTKIEKVVIDGAGKTLKSDLSNVAFNALKSIDASGFKGNASIKVNNNVTKSVKLGSGDDVLKLSVAATAEEKYDGGEGTDIVEIKVTSIAGADLTNYINFEGIKIADALNAELDLAKFGSLDKHIVLAEAADTGSKVVNLANNGTVVFEKASTAQTLEVAIKDDANGKKDVLNIVSKAGDIKVKAEHIETVNVDVAKKGAATVTIDSTKLEALNIKGAADVTLDTASTSLGAAKIVDSTALKGKFTLYATGKETLTSIKGSSQDDTITFDAKQKDLVVEGGAGKDTFTVNANGLTTLDGISTKSFATIADFDVAKDKLTLTGATVTEDNKVAEYKIDANLDFQNNLGQAIKLAGDSASKVAFFKYQDKTTGKVDTYVVSDDNGKIDNNTTVIKLAGDIDVAAIHHDSI